MPEQEDWIKDYVKQLYRDMYFGNGKPGMTTRMQQSEDRHDETDEKFKEIKKYFIAIVGFFAALVGKAIWDLITIAHK